ncbi:chlorite dismutase family protein [Leucobacter sp. HY1908]
MSALNGDHAAATESDFADREGPAPSYSLFAAFRVSSTHPFVVDGRDVPGLVQEIEDVVEMLAAEDVSVRGWYDVSGMHHDADLLVWLHGEAAEDLQWGIRELRRTSIISPLIRVSSALGFHAADGLATPAGAVRVNTVPQQWLAVTQQGPLNLEILEADDLADLAPQLRGISAQFRAGRFVEPVEIIEVLQ